MDLSIIVPCYNEEQNIMPFYELCKEIFDKNLKIEYLFINDGSKDNTLEKIKELINKNKKDNISCISFSRNFGKEAAIHAGLKKAVGKYISLIDADMQQHPKYVLEMYNFLCQNKEYDSVACFQAKRKESKILKVLKKAFYKIINKLSDTPLYENASDFRTIKKEVAEAILELKEYYRFSKGLFSWVGYNTYYMPYEVQERKYGKTSWSIGSLFKYALDGIIGFSVSPLKLAAYIGIISFIISIIYMIVIIIQKFSIGIEVSGYATIVCLILLFGGLQMIFIGIIGEYLGRTYIETKKRPLYIIKEEIKYKEE